MKTMIRPVFARALPNYRLYLEFSDGSKGEVDLSDLASKGVFEPWNNPSCFEKVHIGSHREIKWNDEIELCPDLLYLRLTGKTPEELFPRLQRMKSIDPKSIFRLRVTDYEYRDKHFISQLT